MTEASFRPWRLDDAPSLAANANNRQVWNNVRDYFPHPYTTRDAGEFIRQAISKPVTEDFAVLVDGEVAGGIGYVRKSDVERVGAEIGYWLGRDHWDKGIMGRIVPAFTEYVFRTTDLETIYAGVFGFNRASMRVLEKSGYSFVGIMRNCAIKNGQLIDEHYYQVLRPRTMI